MMRSYGKIDATGVLFLVYVIPWPYKKSAYNFATYVSYIIFM